VCRVEELLGEVERCLEEVRREVTLRGYGWLPVGEAFAIGLCALRVTLRRNLDPGTAAEVAAELVRRALGSLARGG